MSGITYCPACDEDIKLSRKTRLGQIVTCTYCGEKLEVIGLRPLELDFAYDEEELYSDNGYENYEYDDDW